MPKRFYTTGLDCLSREPSPIRQSTCLVLGEDYDRDIAHWKANHADMVNRARLLIERPDMPLVRVKAYELVTQTCQENVELLNKAHEAEILFRDILEFGDIGWGLAERIKNHIKKQEQQR